MRDQINTIREALRLLLPDYPETAITAIDALAAIEADHFTAADMASAAAQGHRDGVARVTAGQKPVKWMCTETKVLYDHDTSEVDKYHGFKPTVPLYTAAPVAQQQEPDITSLLFAVEQAVKNGHCPWEIEAAFDEYEAARKAAPVAQQQAEAVPLLSDAELAALMPPPDIDGSKARSPNAVRLAMRAAEQAVRAKMGVAVPMPPEDWSVFNTGAEVASGLTWAEAWDYMTPSRIERGWTAVCVANKSNIGIVGEEGA